MDALTRIGGAVFTWIAVVCAVVAGGAVVGLVVVGGSASAPAIAAGASVDVAAGFDPAGVWFGDRFVARVVVALDPRRVRAGTLRVSDGVVPLTQLGAARTTRSVRGGLELVSVVTPVSCLTASCVARGGVARVGLPRVVVAVTARSGRVVRMRAAWPVLLVRGRVTGADLGAGSPGFVADTAPPMATYRIGPGVLAVLLEVLAVGCGVGAVALASWEACVRAGRRRRGAGALERALRLTREAERRPVADRRRALALLGRVLGSDRRAEAARRLAWSEPVPEPGELERLVSGIERQVGE